MSLDIQNEIIKILCKVSGGSVAYPNDTLGKWVEDEFVIKQCVQLKDLSTVWLEDADPDQIDERYFNKDGTRKTITK